MRKSAGELADGLSAIGEEIVCRAVAETRRDLADGIEEYMLGRPRLSRAAYGEASPDDCVITALTEWPTLRKDAALRAVAARFEEDGVSSDFRAGVLFAVRLISDLEYEY